MLPRTVSKPLGSSFISYTPGMSDEHTSGLYVVSFNPGGLPGGSRPSGRRAMPLAAAFVAMVAHHVRGGSRGAPWGHPHHPPGPQQAVSREAPGSRVTCRGGSGATGIRAAPAGHARSALGRAGRSGPEQQRGAVAVAAAAAGAEGAAPRPRVRVTWCEAGSHLATNTNREERPPRERQRPLPRRRRPPARRASPTPRDRSLAPPARRGKRPAAPRTPARGRARARPAPDAEAAAPSLREPKRERGPPARTLPRLLPRPPPPTPGVPALRPSPPDPPPARAGAPRRPEGGRLPPGGGRPRPRRPLPEGHAVLPGRPASFPPPRS